MLLTLALWSRLLRNIQTLKAGQEAASALGRKRISLAQTTIHGKTTRKWIHTYVCFGSWMYAQPAIIPGLPRLFLGVRSTADLMQPSLQSSGPTEEKYIKYQCHGPGTVGRRHTRMRNECA